MLLKQVGNILVGKTSAGENVRIVKNGEKTITKLGSTIREKVVKTVPVKDDKEIFKTIFPQYNDFKLMLRHDKYDGKSFGTKDYGRLVGTNSEGREIILMRQNKVNSAYSDITMSYNPNYSVPVNPNEFEAFSSEVKLFKPSDFQVNSIPYTEVTNPFARAYLEGSETLQSTEKATGEFYKIMRSETKNF